MRFRGSARARLYPGQIDLASLHSTAEWLGLAWNVQVAGELAAADGISPVTPRAVSAAAGGAGDAVRAIAVELECKDANAADGRRGTREFRAGCERSLADEATTRGGAVSWASSRSGAE